MRGASVVRRRSVTNPGDTAGSVNGGQADEGGSGLLAGGTADGPAAARRDGAQPDPSAVAGGHGSTAAAGGHASRTASDTAAQAASAAPPGTALAPVTRPGGSRGTSSPSRSAPPRSRRQGSGQSRYALANWRVRYRLAAVIAVPTLIAAGLGAFLIYGDVNNWVASGRVEHLAELNASVVKLTQALENERDLSAGYAANRLGNSALVPALKNAQDVTNADAHVVANEAAGVTTGAGYQPATVQDLITLVANFNDLPPLRQIVGGTAYANPRTKSLFPASPIIQAYTRNILYTANTFSASVGAGANDSDLQANVNTLASLLLVENEMSLQRAILYGALNSPTRTFGPADVITLQQAAESQQADQAEFDASTSEAEQEYFNNATSGSPESAAQFEETLAQQIAAQNPNAPLTVRTAGLTAQNWYANQSVTIDGTRTVADGLVAAISSRAHTLRSQATQTLLITSVVTLLLLFLVVLISSIVARSLTRPLRKLRTDALDVAGHRLPEMVHRLSQSEGTDESVEIEPIGVTSTDEIGEVARAFDQVHREAVRLAADEAMLRGNLNAMFINLSRRSQSLIERQLSLIDSLEQSEQDPGRLSSLFRLDHLATRMRRNSENLLVLAGHEVTRRWSQPVPLVDVLRAAISEIEQYERVVLNVQPGIVVVGQAVNDAVHLVAEIVENATTFSPEDTQVYVSGQPLSSGGVLLDITDNGVGISDQEMSHANWRLDNPPVVDVAVSRRMGLFVVGRLAARHGVRVRLRHAQAGGLTALIWLPDTVAAPEVAPPLGRLRRFEADDYGPVASLSAPPQAPGTGAQATSAARIPRFSPLSPSEPSSPSFTPAADAEPGPALPTRKVGGNGSAAPANGAADDDADERVFPTPGGPGPSRLPAFGGPGPNTPRAPVGPQIGSQNVRGSDGPSAGGPPEMSRTNGTQGTESGDSGQVTVPPPGAQDQRLPIFDSLESDWFRRSGTSVNTARPAVVGQPAAQSWTSPADEGWRAAQALAEPAAGDTTQAGLPRRVPRANLVPGSVGGGGGDAEADAPTRSPEVARTRMASFQRGVREGRAAAPQTEEP